MKKIKALALAGLVVAGLMTIGTTDASAEGPFRNFANCMDHCGRTTDGWTWARNICVADCVVYLAADVNQAVKGAEV